MQYQPYAERPVALQYRTILARVLSDGEWAATQQGPGACTLLQQTMKFRLCDGFPMITERSIERFWRKPIGELCAFINGATTIAELEKFGCDWWSSWATAEKTAPKGLEAGEIGPGSYGGAFHSFPTAEGQPFDQFKHLVEQLRELPNVRTHFVSPWIPQYQARGAGKARRTTVAPCHGWVHVRVINGRLHLHMFQRSGDLPIGVPANMIQYGALLMMLEHLTGYEADSYYHTISDAHIYENQVPYVEEMLARTPLRLPTVRLNEAGRRIDCVHDFRPEHFELADYFPHAAIPNIPVAI
jgi:thymidylate synthase